MLLDNIKQYFNDNNTAENLYFYGDLRVRVVQIEKYRKKITFVISFPRELTDEQKAELEQAIRNNEIVGFKTVLQIVPDKMDADILTRLLKDFIKENCVSAYTELSNDYSQLTVKQNDDRLSVVFDAEKPLKEILLGGVLEKIKNHFDDFTSCKIDYFVNERETTNDAKQKPEELEQNRNLALEAYMSQPQRKVIIEDKRPLIGRLSDNLPKYIIDVNPNEEYVTVCGKIFNISKRSVKNGTMTVCKFGLKDFTSSIPVVYFAKDDKNLGNFSSLCEGDEIILRGKPQISSYDNRLEILCNCIGRCIIAKEQTSYMDDFKPLPPSYVRVSPQKYENASQTNIFGDDFVVPEPLKGQTFVVFDFETTGKEQMKDRVTEIGAVKLCDGRITETFTTLVNPQMHITETTISLNGISDETVKDAPIFQEIAGDFYKFCYGATLVAHNVEFDYGFLKYYATPCGYLFNNKIADTLTMAKRLFSEPQYKKNAPKNYKLETLINYFDLTLDRPHRADCDAEATALLFIKLLSMDKNLLN